MPLRGQRPALEHQQPEHEKQRAVSGQPDYVTEWRGTDHASVRALTRGIALSATVLSVVTSMVLGGTWTLAAIAITTALAVGFIVIAVVGGNLLAKPLFNKLRAIRTSGMLGVVALAFAFLLSPLAAGAGSA